jgi:RNA polymerase sigma factor (sigma-70 family)
MNRCGASRASEILGRSVCPTAPRYPALVAIDGGRADDAAHPRDALRAAFRAHHRAVYTTAHRILADPCDAEDVTQTVFETLALQLRRPEGVRDPERLGAFLKTCAVRECLMVLRRRRWWSTPRAAKALELPPFDPSEPPRAFFVAAVGQILAVLSPEERAVIVLEVVEHCAHHEVAEIMGISISTVRRRLKSAWRRLLAHASEDLRRRLLAGREDTP